MQKICLVFMLMGTLLVVLSDKIGLRGENVLQH